MELYVYHNMVGHKKALLLMEKRSMRICNCHRKTGCLSFWRYS